jgi:glycosyltransferase involved in cell wall biosynthesis
MSKKISVIISVYNGENYLSNAIESVLQQDYDDKEIIVIDDGSIDGTQEVIREFGKKVISIYQKNRGLGAGRNAGVKASSGDYIAFLDHDDVWAPGKLSKQMDIMLSSHNDPLVFSQVKQFICPSLSEAERIRLIVNQSVLPGYIAGTLLISKERFAQVGYFIEENQVGEFIEWYLRALEKNVPIVLLNELGLYRRVHNSNMGRQQDLYKRSDYLKILKASLDRRRTIINY